MSELEHAKADDICEAGLHAFVGGRCRDCGAIEPAQDYAGAQSESARHNLPVAPTTSPAISNAGETATPPRFEKSFVVTFQSGRSTRWLYPDEEMAVLLRYLAHSAAEAHTEGPVPGVTIKRGER